MPFVRLLAAASLAVLGTLVAARTALLQLPRPTPETSPAMLALEQRLALNPQRRRQAALLRSGALGNQPARLQALLAGQGWGHGTLAAVALKQQALAATALGQPQRAQHAWQLLLRRHGNDPASADGLYALGRQHGRLRQTLGQRWPAHPAALAAASEQGGTPGALHLARWGARWPAAATRIRASCTTTSITPRQRQQLAQGLAELGASQEALSCLGDTAPLPATTLLLAQAELHGSEAEQAAARRRLLTLIQTRPQAPQARDAVRLLAADDSPGASRALSQLPPRWQRSAPVQAHRARQAPGIQATQAVLQRWPDDPASWELQWHKARQSALAGRWRDTLVVLQAGDPQLTAALPAALQARRAFWQGLSHWQLGQTAAARARWQQSLLDWPGGYYGWRAAARLGLVDGSTLPAGSPQAQRWTPLESGLAAVDLLWRLGLPLEAWEHWRSVRRGQAPTDSRALQAEGRLREAIGDGWAGLGQQELASLRLPRRQCRLQQLIEDARYRPRQLQALAPAAQAEGIPLALLLGVAMQESRFQGEVRSVVGAIGLLQLMPETAAELHGSRLSAAQLNDTRRNARLGGRYLRQLQQRWSGNPLLTVASYNAGPNAVAGWLTPTLQTVPDLWVEAIPYPETRHYVKTVLGNSWSFAARRQPACP
ncbi:MAG: lytic transglycosylase domain-containing protein [Cyanobacteriota bacterium]|nr:lytic transglycosylase domain-containing protein [Cyanobacteriota bacterium]